LRHHADTFFITTIWTYAIRWHPGPLLHAVSFYSESRACCYTHFLQRRWKHKLSNKSKVNIGKKLYYYNVNQIKCTLPKDKLKAIRHRKHNLNEHANKTEKSHNRNNHNLRSSDICSHSASYIFSAQTDSGGHKRTPNLSVKHFGTTRRRLKVLSCFIKLLLVGVSKAWLHVSSWLFDAETFITRRESRLVPIDETTFLKILPSLPTSCFYV